MYMRVMDEKPLDANTYINVFGQKLVRHFVLLKDVVVDASSSKCSPRKEAEESVKDMSVIIESMQWNVSETHPPRNAPTGLRSGRAAAGVSRRRREV